MRKKELLRKGKKSLVAFFAAAVIVNSALPGYVLAAETETETAGATEKTGEPEKPTEKGTGQASSEDKGSAKDVAVPQAAEQEVKAAVETEKVTEAPEPQTELPESQRVKVQAEPQTEAPVQTEAPKEIQTERQTEAQQAEPQTETRVQTEAQTEAPQTEPQTERQTEVLQTERQTETPQTEVQTERQMEASQTEVQTEHQTEAPQTEVQTERQTEAPQTEVQTERQTEAPQTEVQTEYQTEAPQTEVQTERQTEASQTEPQTERQTEAPQTESETEPQTEAPQTESETEPQTEPVTETETEAESEAETETESESETEALSEKLQALQDRINALPTVEEFKEMTDGEKVEDTNFTQEQYDIYMEAQDICDEYDALSEEDQALLDITKLEALMEYFNEAMTQAADENGLTISAANQGEGPWVIQNKGTQAKPYVVTIDGEVTVSSGKVVFDVQGKSYVQFVGHNGAQINTGRKPALKISADSVVSVKDISMGTLIYGPTWIENSGECTLTNVTISSGGNGCVLNNGTVTVNGGAYKAVTNYRIFDGGTVFFQSGIVDGMDARAPSATAFFVDNLTISGGTIKNCGIGIGYYSNKNVRIDGNVSFLNNDYDIYFGNWLRPLTIGKGFTGEIKVAGNKVAEGMDGIQITEASTDTEDPHYQSRLKLIPTGYYLSGYSMEYYSQGRYWYLKKNRDTNHTWVYASDGKTITATCTEEGCIYGSGALLSVNEGRAYNGRPYQAVSDNISPVTGATVMKTYSGMKNDGTSYGPVADPPTDAGSYKVNVTLTPAEGDPYVIEDTFKIMRRSAEIIADPAGKTYGETDPQLTWHTEDTVAQAELGEDDIAITREAGEDADTYTITPSAKDTANKNYSYIFKTAEFTIDQAAPAATPPTIITDLMYNGTVQELITAGSTTGGTLEYSLDGTNWSEDVLQAKDAGTYQIYYRVSGGKNYEDVAATQLTEDVAIAQRPAEIIADPAGKTYGETDTQLTWHTEDTVAQAELGEDDIAITREAGEDAGTYTITASVKDTANKNYSYTFKTAEFTINKAAQQAPTVQTVDETIKGRRDGKMAGLTAAMEYRAEGDTSYTAVTGEEVTDLAPGTYYVRYQEDPNHTASQDTTAVIAEGKMVQIILSSDQKGYTLTASREEAAWGEEVLLTLTLAPGYSKTENFALKVNGVAVTLGEDNTCTLKDLEADAQIAVEGVADITAPQIIGVETDGVYTGSVTFTVEDEYLAKVTVDGELVFEDDGNAAGTTAGNAESESNTGSEDNSETSGFNALAAVISTAAENEAAAADTETGNGVQTLASEENTNGGAAVQTVDTFTLIPKMDTYRIEASDASGNSAVAANITVNWNEVQAPDGGSKEYTGETLTSDLTDGTIGEASYTVTENAGGIDAGTYDVKLTLTDPVNYKWETEEGGKADTVVTFTIIPKSIADAKVVLGPSLRADGSEQTQTVEKVVLDGKELPSDVYLVENNVATEPGTYILTVRAKDGGNYTGEVQKEFEILEAETETETETETPEETETETETETPEETETETETPAETETETETPAETETETETEAPEETETETETPEETETETEAPAETETETETEAPAETETETPEETETETETETPAETETETETESPAETETETETETPTETETEAPTETETESETQKQSETKKQTETNKQAPASGTTPRTGDTTPLVGYAVVCVLSLTAALLLGGRKKFRR